MHVGRWRDNRRLSSPLTVSLRRFFYFRLGGVLSGSTAVLQFLYKPTCRACSQSVYSSVAAGGWVHITSRHGRTTLLAGVLWSKPSVLSHFNTEWASTTCTCTAQQCQGRTTHHYPPTIQCPVEPTSLSPTCCTLVYKIPPWLIPSSHHVDILILCQHQRRSPWAPDWDAGHDPDHHHQPGLQGPRPRRAAGRVSPEGRLQRQAGQQRRPNRLHQPGAARQV